jgi:hypothetical protein
VAAGKKFNRDCNRNEKTQAGRLGSVGGDGTSGVSFVVKPTTFDVVAL